MSEESPAPDTYEWSDSDTPILDLHESLGHDPTENIAVSYLGEAGIWETRHVQLRYADSFARSVRETNDVYVMVNEVSQLSPGSGGRGDTSQISRVKALYADLDFKDSGLKDAETAKEIISTLSAMLNCNPVAIVFSGYGLQPYWEIEDAGVNDTNRTYMIGLMKRWGQFVQRVASIHGGKVDNVYDLPRVLRAPGTFNRKRGGKVPTLIAKGKWAGVLSIEQLEETLASYGFTNEDNPVDDFIVISDPSSWEPAEHDCQATVGLVSEITQGNPDARHPWLVGKAVKITAFARHGCLSEETYSELVQLLDDKFKDLLATSTNPRQMVLGEVASAFTWARALVSSFDDAKLADAVGYHTHAFGQLRAVEDLPKGSANVASITPEGKTSVVPTGGTTASDGNLALVTDIHQAIEFQEEAFAYTDTANAARLAARITGRYIFVPKIGWFLWDGARYIPDELSSITNESIKSVHEYAKTAYTDRAKKWVEHSLMAGAIGAAVSLASARDGIVMKAMGLDTNAYELCTPKGIVNLRDGTFRDADPYRDFNTKQTNIAPATDVEPKIWLTFLRQVLEDQERIDYMQELLGVALIGEVLYQELPLLVGVGANGKSTLLEAVGLICGDYVATMPENFLMEKNNGDHSTELARLRGVRIALASETKPDGRFNESRAKSLTSQDVVSARFMNKDFFDFLPSHSFLVALNHPPRVTHGGEGFWRRMRKIDFNVIIPENRRDPELARNMVKREGAGILQWMIEGARRVMTRGTLVVPAAVAAATLAYREEEDALGVWLKTKTFPSAGSRFKAIEIYNNYKGWMTSEGETPITASQLIRELKVRGLITQDLTTKERWYAGLGMIEN